MEQAQKISTETNPLTSWLAGSFIGGEMKKKILIIGGSYFIGRVFCSLAEKSGEFDISLMNRGTLRLNRDKITEYTCDRHDTECIQNIVKKKRFDAVIDFCAYQRGDCKTLLEALGTSVNQYIEISSCSVLQPSAESRNETAPVVQQMPQNIAEEYSYHKMLLEEETKETCSKMGIPYTILRPTFVYGPFNYAPRENYYFKLMFDEQEIPTPKDATAEFQFVYVKDIARAIMKCIGQKKAYDEIIQLAAPECITYESWTDFLRTLEVPFQTKDVTVREVYEQDIPVPFPLDQNELYAGNKAQELLGLEYTPFERGMKETFDVYKLIHRK